jgi:uncharacterized repeat protein (TIGR01451 family)
MPVFRTWKVFPVRMARSAVICTVRWLLACLALFGSSAAMAQLQTNVAFSPTVIAPAGTSVLQITLINNTLAPANSVSLNAALPSSPAGLTISSTGLISNTCGGTLTVPVGGSSIALSGGTVAASASGVSGECTIQISVQAAPPTPPASYTFSIPAANVTSSIGGPTSSVSATLQVLPANPLTGSLTISTANIHGFGTPVRLRLQLNNSNGYALTGTNFTNTLPTQLQFAPAPNTVSSCGGTLTVLAGGTIWSLSGGTIPASGICFIEADFITRNDATIPANGNATMSLPIGAITTTQTASNISSISRSILVQKAATVTGAFNPAAILAGGTSTLTITLSNFNSAAISGFSFSSAMPAGVTITGGVSTSCAGATSFTATTISLTGATLAAAPTVSGSASCTITMTVTAPATGNFTNIIQAGAIGGISYVTTTANLLVSSVSVSKAFSPVTTALSGVTVLTITLTNRQVGTAANITSFSDLLTTMGTGFTVSGASAPATTCGGTITAPVGGTSISMAGGTIPAAPSTSVAGTCTITVNVQVAVNATTGTRTNTVAVGGLRTSLGNNLVSATASLNVAAPITVNKNFSVVSATGGSVVRLTVTLDRAAYAGFMTNLAFTDNMPVGFTIAATPAVSSTCTGGTVNAVPGSGTLSMTGASLGTTLSASATCTVSVNVQTSSILGNYTNSIAIGQVTATTPAGNVSNLTASSRAITIVDGIAINTSFSVISVTPGQVSRLRITVTNPASLATELTSVGLTDNLPSGLQIAPIPNPSLTASGGSCTGTINALAGANSFSLSGGSFSSGAVCVIEVDVSPIAIGSLLNTIPIGALSNAQGRSNQNAASATLLSSGNADVSVTKNDGVSNVIVGATSVYTITIRNASSILSVAGLPVEDSQPDDLSFTAWTCAASSGSSCQNPTGTGPISSAVTLAPLGTATYTVTALVDAASARTSITNTVSVNPSAIGIFDPNNGNNTAQDTNTITTSADVSVTKTSDRANPAVGSAVTFTITVANAGPSVAQGVTASDTLPAGYTLVSATPSVGSFVDPVWTIGDMAPGTSATLLVVATVNPAGPYTNTVTVTSTTNDPNTANNSSNVTPAPVALRIEKNSIILSDTVNGAANPFSLPGAIVEYNIIIRNEGSAIIDTNSIIISDILPTQVAVKVTGPGSAIVTTDGTPTSGLTGSSPVVVWTNRPGGAGPYSYTPVPDADGFDSAVTGFRIQPSGAMNGGAPGSAPNVRFTYQVRIN